MLVFIPVVAAHRVGDPAALVGSAVAFVAFGLVASAVYVLNDVADLQADREHPRKRNRPFASGALPVAAAAAAGRLAAQGSGTLLAISSVAGDRGRQSNYVYGAAKGGLSTYLEGLRNRLFRRGVHVVTVKPGFVDSPMTAHLPKNALFASPAAVARAMVRAAERRRDVVYVPGFWRVVMWIIRRVPERIFKRLSL